jgi:hypothetical protein
MDSDSSFITQDFELVDIQPNFENYLLYNLMSIRPLSDAVSFAVSEPLLQLDDRILALESRLKSIDERIKVLEKKLAPKKPDQPGSVADFGLSQKRRSSKEEKNNVLKLLELKGDSPYVNVDGVKVDLS